MLLHSKNKQTHSFKKKKPYLHNRRKWSDGLPGARGQGLRSNIDGHRISVGESENILKMDGCNVGTM